MQRRQIITSRERRQMYAFFCVWLAILSSLHVGSWKWYYCFQNKEREQHHCWWCQAFIAIYTPDRCLQQGEQTALYWYHVKYTFKYNISLKHKAISMRESIFSHWEGILASWGGNYETDSVSTKHLFVFDGHYVPCHPGWRVVITNYCSHLSSTTLFIWTWPWEGTNTDLFS